MMNYSGDMSSTWGWILWFGIFLLFFSSFGNWGYTYQAHRRFKSLYPPKNGIDFLNERYARGEIDRDEFHRVKNEILDISSNSTRSSILKPLRPQTNIFSEG